MNRFVAHMFTLLFLVSGMVSCSWDDGAVVDQNRFNKTYTDLVGTMKAALLVNGWDHEAGDSLTMSYDIDVTFKGLVTENIRDMVQGVWVAWYGERIFDRQGRYYQMSNTLSSTYLTTTGIPIENSQPMIPSKKMGNFYSSPFDFVDYFPIEPGDVSSQMHLSGKWERLLDQTVPPGYYRLGFDLFLDVKGQGPRMWSFAPFMKQNEMKLYKEPFLNLLSFRDYTETVHPKRFLPMIKVGTIQKDLRMPWIIFRDVLSHGNVGVVANEDRETFGLSYRYRFPSKMILSPGEQKIYPCFVTNFPRPSGNIQDIGGATLVHREIEHYLDFNTGHVSVSILCPNGETVSLGMKKFVGKRSGGPKLQKGDFSFDFDQWGKYTIIMEGEIFDVLGRKIKGGGHYDFWIGKWLTFSSTVKPGKNFDAGNRYPPKVEVHPPCPANVQIDITYYPMSDPERKETLAINGRANPFGYFFPDENTPTMIFKEPGEYRADVFADYVSGDGTHWFGHQTSAGVIQGNDSRVALHGLRSSFKGVLNYLQDNYGMKARFATGDEGSMGINMTDISDCDDVMIPFYTGDTLHISATMSHFGNVTSYLSLEPKDPALRQELFEAFYPSPLLTFQPKELMEPGLPRMLKFDMLAAQTYIIRNDESADMFPILMQNRYGYQPFNFPESNEVEAYAYFSSIRPGFSAFTLTSDSSTLGSYWSASPNIYGKQFNAGVNGDMPSDIYLNFAGLVYKDKRRGTVDYATYSSSIVVDPKDTQNVRTVAPLAEPLFTVNGSPVWLALAMGTNEVLVVGDRVSLGLVVIPAVPATIDASLTWPDNERIETVQGVASSIGNFQGKVFRLDKPGVYRAKVLASYGGKSGYVFGSGDGVFNHYVVEKDRPDLLNIDLPTYSKYDVSKILEVPITIKKGYSDAKITYSLLFPGMIMDEGEFTTTDNKAVFRYIPSQFAMQFPNFDIRDYRLGRPRQNDSVFMIFFAEAQSPEGQTVYDVKKLMIREDNLYYFGSTQEQTHPSGHSPGKNDS